MFVNNAITNGINAYLKKSNNETYPLSNSFELKVIELLIKIYGHINILNPYKLMNVDSLKTNLMIYGATKDEIEKLFSLLNDYNEWLNSNSKEKNNIIKEIYEILSDLVIYKNKSTIIESEEMKYYEDFFSINDPKIKQIVDMCAKNKDELLNVWPEKVAESKKEKPKEEPLFLSEEEYEKYGVYLEDVKKLPENKIRELNEQIKIKNEDNANGGTTKEKPWQLVLTSGNGYVDALVLFSIMCTEIMVGIIITIIIWRF